MATARSGLLSLRTLNRVQPRFRTSTLRACSRCNARQYSDRPDVETHDLENLQQPESYINGSDRRAHFDNEEGGSSSSSSSVIDSTRDTRGQVESLDKDSGKAKKANVDYLNLLIQDDVHVQPGLSALDELRPRLKKGHRDLSKAMQEGWRFTSESNKDWKKTLELIKRSFTSPQLEHMCADAGVPKDLYKLYEIRGRKNAPKDVRARLLMVHRFKMEDPAMVSKRALQSQQESNETKQIPIAQLTFLLLALRAQTDVQQLLQYHGVRLRLTKRTDDGSSEPSELALLLQGPKEGIKEVEGWILAFRDSIRSFVGPVSTFSLSDSSMKGAYSRRLRQISQISKAAVSIDEDRNEVTIHHLDDASLSLAQSHLVQFYQNEHSSQKRQYFSYASPPVSLQTRYSVPTFAFEPHVGLSPIPWLSDVGASATLFRLTRQDIIDSKTSPFSVMMQDDPDKPILRHLNIPEDYDSTKLEFSGDDTFQLLHEQLKIEDDSPGAFVYSAEFGNLLIDNQSRASSSKVLSLIRPPLSGSWPLEHALQWLREKASMERVITPSFLPNTPPIAVSMDAGIASASTVAPGLDEGRGFSAEERFERKSEYWNEHIRQYGFKVKSIKNDLRDILDLKSPHFEEVMVVKYSGALAELVIELQRVEKKNSDEATEGIATSSGWIYDKAEWVNRSEGDVIVPEAAVDLRLSTRHAVPVEGKEVAKDERLQQFFLEHMPKAMPDARLLPDGASNSAPDEEKQEMQQEESLIDAPSSVTVQGHKMQLSSARRTSRWRWDLQGERAHHYQGCVVMEKTALENDVGYTSSVKIEYAEGAHERRGQGEGSQEAEEGSEREERTGEQHMPSTPRWQDIRPYVDVFLTKRYHSLQQR
ncbi:hypothetical protein CBS101457_002657 [Exobasidium rhododendri]|nr:hypothetical protein CBS101457_002657 [Exobasidium rhododendri]